jgi:hypothetical protein
MIRSFGRPPEGTGVGGDLIREAPELSVEAFKIFWCFAHDRNRIALFRREAFGPLTDKLRGIEYFFELVRGRYSCYAVA